MKRRLFLSTMVIFGLGLIQTVKVSADSYDDQIASYQVQIQSNETKINELQAKEATYPSQYDQLNTQLKEFGLLLETNETQLSTLEKVVLPVDATKENVPTLLTKTITLEETSKEKTISLSEQIQEKENEVTTLSKKIAELQGQLNTLKTQESTEQQTKESLTKDITTYKTQITALQAEQKAYKEEQARIAAEKAAREAKANMRQNLVNGAYAQLGKPYVWGAQGPNSFDCSGLMNYLYTNIAGLSIGSWTVPQESSGTKISVSEANIGDLLFWGSVGSTYHVAMYIGNGQYIAAPKPGDVVKVGSISSYTPDFAVNVLG